MEINQMIAIFATSTMTMLDFTMIKLEFKVPDLSSKTSIIIKINQIARIGLFS